ncbi:MAG: rhodanese-like domain-containing protein [Planctomycetota bacterium]
MDIPEIDIEQAQRLLEDGATFVDVRDPDSFQASHIPGAVHIGDHNVKGFVDATDKNSHVVVYCYRGHSSLGATAFLRDHGFTNVASLTGGFTAWHAAGGSAEPGAAASGD